MTHNTQRLAHRGATTLGFGLLVPGIVMLMWFYSAATGISRQLYTIAVALSIGGATFLLIAITLRLTQHFKRTNGPRDPPPAQGNPIAPPPPPGDDSHWVTELHPVPSYRTVMADTPGAIWTVPRISLHEGGLPLSQPVPPPLYESVVDGETPNGGAHLFPSCRMRRVESESDAVVRLKTLDLGPFLSIEPLTPPPLYDQIQLDQVFNFEPRSDME